MKFEARVASQLISGPSTSRELAAELGVSSYAIHNACRRLVARGTVIRAGLVEPPRLGRGPAKVNLWALREGAQ